MATNSKKLFYGRCSTSHQKMSEELQLDAVQRKFGSMDEVFFDKSVSGSAPLNRKIELLNCLECLGKGDTLYIYSLSRLSRETLQALFIEKEISVKGASLVSVQEEEQCGDSPEKVMMRTILSAVAQYEKELIKARIKSSRATMRKKGRYLGGKRQYGWKVIGQGLVAVPHEQAVISKIGGWKDKGMKTQEIADALNKTGIQSATGTGWHYNSVRKLLKRI